VLPTLHRLVRRARPDGIGIAAGAIHALWTIHGLGALDGSNAEALAVAREALDHTTPGVRKAAIQTLPATAETAGWLLERDLANDPDAHTRLAALLRFSEMPASAPIGAALYALSEQPDVRDDTWLSEAVYLAAARHRDGFLDAYSAAIGGAEFARLTAAYARGEPDSPVDWSPVTFDDSAWDSTAVPGTWEDLPAFASFDGAIWYRRSIDLPSHLGGRAGRIHLGEIYDSDVVFVNGQNVGETVDGFDTKREYAIPADLLTAGSNVLAVRVEDPRGRGGFWGEEGDLFLQIGGERVSIAGSWRYAVEEEYVGGKREDLKKNSPLARQFLKHYATQIAGAPAPELRTVVEDAGGTVELALSVVAGQLLFDRAEMVVPAGARVSLTFANTDDMPHNVLLVAPAQAEAVGALADAMVTAPDAANRNYVPESPAILASTPLVAPRQTAVLTFTAPSTPGNYPYLCTFPGHWRTMRGVLRVL
jgi:azurin